MNHLVVGVSLFDKTGQDSLGPVVEVRIASAKENGNLAGWIILVHDLLRGINQVVDTRPSRDKRDRLCAFSEL